MKKVKRNNNFYNETEQLAKLHSKLFNINEDEALLHILNSNDYNYKGYYDEYGNLKPDKNNHFTDKYKTAFHNTFSNESIYSGKKSQYNPLGIVGGYWDENNNFIQSGDMKKVKKENQYNNVDKVLFNNIVPSAVGTNRTYGQMIKENILDILNNVNPAALTTKVLEPVNAFNRMIEPYIPEKAKQFMTKPLLQIKTK